MYLLLRIVCAILIIFSPLFPATVAFSESNDSTSNASQQINAHINYQSDSYKISQGDTLSVVVTPQKEFNYEGILVRSDGTASFPGIGELPVSGKTTTQVSNEIEEHLSKWLRHAVITVSVVTPRSLTVYLSGAVMKPGSFQMVASNNNENLHINNDSLVSRIDPILTNILVNSGGVSLDADLSKVQVKRFSTGEILTVNLWKLLKEGAVSEDIWLNNNDAIFIPELPPNTMQSDEDFSLLLKSSLAPKTFPVRVIGEVHDPSSIELDSQSPLLDTAISKAGGYAPQAEKQVVAVRRFVAPYKFNTLYVDPSKMDFLLRPNDVVYVGENRVYKLGRFMQQAALALSPFQAAAMTGMGTAQTFGLGGWSKRIRKY